MYEKSCEEEIMLDLVSVGSLKGLFSLKNVGKEYYSGRKLDDGKLSLLYIPKKRLVVRLRTLLVLYNLII